VKGSVAHDVGALPKGHALRNVSDYAGKQQLLGGPFPQAGDARAAQM